MGLDLQEIFSESSLLLLLFGLKGGTETVVVWPAISHIIPLVLIFHMEHIFNVPLKATVLS